ncbi:MAG TPA: VOC family protein [Thermomicrobiales bacterium]|nr:VOC family protein [Thermomicrobiales bacterium]
MAQSDGIQGIHHITLVSADAQRTVDFYTDVLGLRLVKQTVNFDDPGAYHLYFGDAVGSPGSAITFFEWKNTPQGHPGIGGTHHYALETENRDTLLRWKRRLTDHGLSVSGPLDRHYFTSIYFQDPDGVIIEIATRGPGWTVDEEPDHIGEEHRPPPEEMMVANRDSARIEAETWPEPVDRIDAEMALRHGMHHITAIGTNIERTHGFYSDLLGMRRLKMTDNFDDPGSAHWYWGVGNGAPGTVVTYFERDPKKERRVQMGRGQTHHFALVVPDEESQLALRQRLVDAGFECSPVIDRSYFLSVYTHDPDGHIIELATAGPGFLTDEDEASLGTALRLPPQLEARRAELEQRLTPLNVSKWRAPD